MVDQLDDLAVVPEHLDEALLDLRRRAAEPGGLDQHHPLGPGPEQLVPASLHRGRPAHRRETEIRDRRKRKEIREETPKSEELRMAMSGWWWGGGSGREPVVAAVGRLGVGAAVCGALPRQRQNHGGRLGTEDNFKLS